MVTLGIGRFIIFYSRNGRPIMIRLVEKERKCNHWISFAKGPRLALIAGTIDMIQGHMCNNFEYLGILKVCAIFFDLVTISILLSIKNGRELAKMSS
jgi:hypothetical protein